MAISTSLRSKRAASRQVEKMQQVLIFRLRQDWFALPAVSTLRVIQVDQLYGNVSGASASLALYQDREIPVIDIKERIFESQSQKLLAGSAEAGPVTQPSQRSYYLIIVPNAQQEFVGLLLDLPPVLKRVRQAAINPLSATYLAQGHIRCVSALIVEAADQPPVFLLNLHQLVSSPMALPASSNTHEASL